MSTQLLEDRVAALEDEVERLKKESRILSPTKREGWQRIYGTFANDPLYEEAMRLGREYREAQRETPEG